MHIYKNFSAHEKARCTSSSLWTKQIVFCHFGWQHGVKKSQICLSGPRNLGAKFQVNSSLSFGDMGQ